MDSIAIDTRNRGYQSRYLAEIEERENVPDRETLENLAALMGVDVQAIEAEIAEQERIHRAAWKKGRKSKQQHASSVTQFIEVVEFQGKQLFWSLGGQQFVVGAGGKTFFESTIKDALHRLACE